MLNGGNLTRLEIRNKGNRDLLFAGCRCGQDRAVAAKAAATAAAAQAELNQNKSDAKQAVESGESPDGAPIVALSLDLFV